MNMQNTPMLWKYVLIFYALYCQSSNFKIDQQDETFLNKEIQMLELKDDPKIPMIKDCVKSDLQDENQLVENLLTTVDVNVNSATT